MSQAETTHRPKPTTSPVFRPHTPLGTATISPYCNFYVVQCTELHSQPQYFRTEDEAIGFCREHDLQVI